MQSLLRFHRLLPLSDLRPLPNRLQLSLQFKKPSSCLFLLLAEPVSDPGGLNLSLSTLLDLSCRLVEDEIATMEATERDATRRHYDVSDIAPVLGLVGPRSAPEQEAIHGQRDGRAAVEQQAERDGDGDVDGVLSPTHDIKHGVQNDNQREDKADKKVRGAPEHRLQLSDLRPQSVVQAQGKDGAEVRGPREAVRAHEVLILPHAQEEVLEPKPQHKRHRLQNADSTQT
mmetsp:Transcript_60245/g.196929  ORF Transcript_60245/g.196929 Transcript_60245/m.196929 type:complete len:229 (-) Transcript_60245:853-1539(-)